MEEPSLPKVIATAVLGVVIIFVLNLAPIALAKLADVDVNYVQSGEIIKVDNENYQSISSKGGSYLINDKEKSVVKYGEGFLLISK